MASLNIDLGSFTTQNFSIKGGTIAYGYGGHFRVRYVAKACVNAGYLYFYAIGNNGNPDNLQPVEVYIGGWGIPNGVTYNTSTGTTGSTMAAYCVDRIEARLTLNTSFKANNCLAGYQCQANFFIDYAMANGVWANIV